MNRHIKILDVFYGNKCNLACEQCDTRSEHIRTDEFDPDLENIKEGILLANKHFDVENWSVLGGEPFLYKDKIIEILKFIRSIEPNKTIFFPTNGMLLAKNLDFAAHIISEYNVWMQVCNHISRFKDSTKSDKIKQSCYDLANKLGIQESNPKNKWWYDIMKYDSGTPGWQEHLKIKNFDINDSLPNETSWVSGNRGIAYFESRDFQSLHYFSDEGKPKPFNSPDPSKPYWHSCPSAFCAFLSNKKIYKCAALGTLRKFLEVHNSTDDPDWQKYLDYRPVDLLNISDRDIENFSDTHYCHINECSMCPEKSVKILKTEENVLPMFFKKKKGNIC